MRDLKNKSKLMKTSLVALTLATTVVSQTNVNVYAEEVVNDTQEETEIVNTENTDSLEESTEEESTDIQEESNTETTETNEVSEEETTPTLEETTANEEIEPLSDTKNAGSFNVTGGTSGTEWEYNNDTNTLTFNTGGTYTVTGDGQQTSEKIVVADNFNGTISIENINIQTGQPFYVANTANLTLMLEGTNRLQSTQDFQTALMFQGAITGHLVIDSKNNGSLEARGQNSAGIGGGYGTGSDANNITIKGGTINAYGGLDGAGIGSGYLGKASNIKITGGTVNAFGANHGGAGIGSGNGGYAENIIIEGGTVYASSPSGGAGIGSGWNGKAENIIIERGTVYASSPSSGAGIGSGWNGEANNIKITGGMVTAIGGDGAGIGGGKSGIANDITVTGGTVTATSYGGYGIGSGYKGSSSNITIIGGSVKASMSSKPTDGNGNIVYLTKIDELDGIDEVIVDGNQTFVRNGAHEGDDAFYLYLTGKNHTVSANGKMYQLQWNGDSGFLIKETISAPTVNILSKTISSITVRPLADTDIFGDAEYSINNTDWQSSNVFTGLTADKEYIVYARYKGNDRYTQSETGSIIVKTLKDGNALVEDSKPTNLSGVYGQKLSEIKLPDDWTWVDGNTVLSVGPQRYTARFDTEKYKEEYDFTNVDEYDGAKYVKLNLTVNVSKANSSIEFTTSSLDKEYDGNIVNLTVIKSGSTKDVTFTWYQEDENRWKELSSAPVDAGNYKVVASVEADDKYNGASAELEFVISRTANTWTNKLSIGDWIYGEQPNSPTATSKYGTVTFTYSNKEDGTYTETVPTEAGTWYVKASVVGNENYTGLESIESFKIKKADSSITITTSSLDKAYDGKAVEVPEYTTSGSKGQVTIKWQKNTGTDSSPVWEDLTDAPSTAGSYQVVVELAGDNNYNSASATKTFAISKSENKWTDKLSIDNWTYGNKAKKPIATSKYGTVTFTYSDSKDGTYADTVPTNAGTYYVKATVVGNENYSGLEDIVEFTIKKAESSISFKEGFTLNKTYDGNAVVIDEKDLETKGSTGNIVFTYEEKIDDTWTVLENAPTKAGTYRVTATLNEDANHNSSTSKALEFVIEKADTVLEFSTDNMNKTYDTEAVSEPTIKKTGSSNEVVFTWYKNDGVDWQKLSSAPVDAGNYKIVVSVEADNNYNETSAELEFTISQNTNEWTEELSIEGWTYGDEAKKPIATSKYGEVVFTYSDSKDGTYTNTVPTNAGTYYVKATVAGNENYTGLELIKSFEIKKADSELNITTSSLDKEYDGNTVNDPDVEESGSTKDVTFTWFKKDGNGWKELSSAPVEAGNYKVVASVEGDDNYNGVTAELEFVINQTANEWTNELSIEGWIYGDEAKKPIATSKYGEVVFTYSNSKDGTYTDTVPTNAGTYYVKATVDGSENYTGLEEIMSFEISKAVPEYSVPTDLTIEQGNPLSAVKLPKGFTWKDETQKADKLGKQTFKAIYTPEDTNNYQTVETDITVNVVAKTPLKDESDDSKTEGTNTSKQTNQMMWESIATLSALLILALSVLKLRKHK